MEGRMIIRRVSSSDSVRFGNFPPPTLRGQADIDVQGTFLETSMPVVEYYRERNKVVEIDSSPSIDEVYAVVKREMDARLPKKGPANE